MKNTETLIFMRFITFVSGIISAFTFINSFGLYTNGKTGVTTKFAVSLVNGNISDIVNTFLIIVFCIFGSVIYEFSQDLFKNSDSITLKVMSVMTILPIILTFIDNYIYTIFYMAFYNGYFICAYRICNGLKYNTTICTGTMSIIGKGIYDIITKKENSANLILHLNLFFSFIAGMILMSFMHKYIGNFTLILPSFILFYLSNYIKNSQGVS